MRRYLLINYCLCSPVVPCLPWLSKAELPAGRHLTRQVPATKNATSERGTHFFFFLSNERHQFRCLCTGSYCPQATRSASLRSSDACACYTAAEPAASAEGSSGGSISVNRPIRQWLVIEINTLLLVNKAHTES